MRTNALKFVNKNLSVVGAAWREGQSLTGVEKSPRVFREAGLLNALKNTLGYTIHDFGDISIKSLKNQPDYVQLSQSMPEQWQKDLLAVGRMNELLSKQVEAASKNQQMSLVLGGDHSLGVGSVHGQLMRYGDDLRLIWIDAHADVNTVEMSSSHHSHGMPVAFLLGLIEGKQVPGFEWVHSRLKPEHIVYIGIRNLDPEEKRAINSLGIRYFTPYDVEDRGGIKYAMDEALSYLQLDRKDLPLHVSFDVDACSSSYLKGTGTPERFGLTERETIYLLRRAYETGCLVHLDIAETNIDQEKGGAVFKDTALGDNPFITTTSMTLYNSCEFTLFALGKEAF